MLKLRVSRPQLVLGSDLAPHELTRYDGYRVAQMCILLRPKKSSLNPKPVWCFFQIVALTTNCQFVVIATNCLFVVSAQTGSCGNNSETPRMAKLQVPTGMIDRYQCDVTEHGW